MKKNGQRDTKQPARQPAYIEMLYKRVIIIKKKKITTDALGLKRDRMALSSRTGVT